MDNANLLRTSGVAACNSLLEPVILARRNGVLRQKLSLQGLVIQKIIKADDWIEATTLGAFFKHLPQPILLEILKAFVDQYSKSEEHLNGIKWRFLSLILEAIPSVTEMDLWPWRLHFDNCNMFETILLTSCPQLKSLTKISLGAKSELFQGDDDDFGSSIPMNPLVLKMKNLCILRLINIYLDMESLQIACNTLENIKVLEISICDQNAFHNLDCLAKLRSLKELYIQAGPAVFIGSLKQATEIQIMLLQLLTHLEVFGSSFLAEILHSAVQFLVDFNRFLPYREILIDCLCLDKTFDSHVSEWPAHLKLRRLIVVGPLSKSALKKLCRLVPTDQLRATEFDSLKPDSMYSLVEALGENISHLTIGCRTDSLRRQDRSMLDLHKVLLAIPRIKDFRFEYPLPLIVDPEIQLDASFFKHTYSFEVEILRGDGRQSEMRKIFRMFILGSEACDNLKIDTCEMLEVALETVRQHPACGVRLRRLTIEIYTEAVVELALELGATLILRSPVLEEILFVQLDPLRESELWLEKPDQQWFYDLINATGVKFRVAQNRFERFRTFQFSRLPDIYSSDYATKF